MISQRGRYALKALLHIARAPAGKPCQVAVIAEQEAIPRRFLEAILNELRREGIVTSLRGSAGGYLLSRPADRISFGDVIRLVDGPIALVRCASKTAYRRCADCATESECALRKVMVKVRDDMAATLDHVTLAEASRPMFQLVA